MSSSLDPRDYSGIYFNAKSAIVQSAAVKNCAYYEKKFELICSNHEVEFSTLLDEFKTSGAWREKYKSWQEACDTAFGISARHANRLISNKKVGHECPVESPKISPNSQQPQPDTNSVSSEFTKPLDIAPKTASEKLVDEDDGRDGKTPAVSGRKAGTVQVDSGPVKPNHNLDETGFKIPDEALAFWGRRQEVQDILTQISRIKGVIEQAKTDGDCMYGRVSNAAIADLSKAYTHIADAKPYAVCTQCGGSPSLQPSGCGFCGSSGMISKWRYDTQSREEVKTIREKTVAQTRV